MKIKDCKDFGFVKIIIENYKRARAVLNNAENSNEITYADYVKQTDALLSEFIENLKSYGYKYICEGFLTHWGRGFHLTYNATRWDENEIPTKISYRATSFR